jgi:hypothetical protein
MEGIAELFGSEDHSPKTGIHDRLQRGEVIWARIVYTTNRGRCKLMHFTSIYFSLFLIFGIALSIPLLYP